MAKNRIYMIVVVFAIAVTVISSIQAFYVPLNKVGEEFLSANEVTEEESLDIAREFVLNSPTYRFDGENLVHVETLALRCPSCWQVVFKFTCRHAGYGDRSKLKVLQVITEHTAVVTVVEGEVTEAVLDGTWDMINQAVIQGEGSPSANEVTEEESLDIAREFVLNSPTYRFDGENLVHVETLALRCPSCWQVVFKFTCRHAGYGDRSKLKVLQVITEHTAVVTVVEGEVTEAVLDGTWDMINQAVIQGEDITETEDLYMWKKSSAAYNYAAQ